MFCTCFANCLIFLKLIQIWVMQIVRTASITEVACQLCSSLEDNFLEMENKLKHIFESKFQLLEWSIGWGDINKAIVLIDKE